MVVTNAGIAAKLMVTERTVSIGTSQMQNLCEELDKVLVIGGQYLITSSFVVFLIYFMSSTFGVKVFAFYDFLNL